MTGDQHPSPSEPTPPSELTAPVDRATRSTHREARSPGREARPADRATRSTDPSRADAVWVAGTGAFLLLVAAGVLTHLGALLVPVLAVAVGVHLEADAGTMALGVGLSSSPLLWWVERTQRSMVLSAATVAGDAWSTP